MRTLWKLQCRKTKSLRAVIKRRIKVDSGSDEQLQRGKLRCFDTGKSGWGMSLLLTLRTIKTPKMFGVVVQPDCWPPHLCMDRLITPSRIVSVWLVSVTSVCILLLLNSKIMSADGFVVSLCQFRRNYFFRHIREKNGGSYNGLLYKRAFSCCFQVEISTWTNNIMGKKVL